MGVHPSDEASADLADAVFINVVGQLRRLDGDTRRRMLWTLAVHFGDSAPPTSPAPLAEVSGVAGPQDQPSSRFSEDRSPSPKQFLAEKRPRTDVERVTCLAYYLAHYRSQPQFKTADLSMLNSEAGFPKFSNATMAVDNATRSSYLLPTSKGSKQISMLGELYVEALPDRERAKATASEHRPRRKARSAGR
jgi:hypothetical protein